MDAAVEKGQPDEDATGCVKPGLLPIPAAGCQHQQPDNEASSQGRGVEGPGIKDSDDDDAAEVIDDGQGRQEDDEAPRRSGSRQGQDAQGKGDVRRHGDSPAARRRQAGIKDTINSRWHQHAA